MAVPWGRVPDDGQKPAMPGSLSVGGQEVAWEGPGSIATEGLVQAESPGPYAVLRDPGQVSMEVLKPRGAQGQRLRSRSVGASQRVPKASSPLALPPNPLHPAGLPQPEPRASQREGDRWGFL